MTEDTTPAQAAHICKVVRVDCTVCFDKGVIHFTDLAPSSKHEPVPGERVPRGWRR